MAKTRAPYPDEFRRRLVERLPPPRGVSGAWSQGRAEQDQEFDLEGAVTRSREYWSAFSW
jgi:hypothetical protein